MRTRCFSALCEIKLIWHFGRYLTSCLDIRLRMLSTVGFILHFVTVLRIEFRLFWFIFQIDKPPNTIWHCYGDSGDSRHVFGYVCILALFRGSRAYILIYSAVRPPWRIRFPHFGSFRIR